MAGSAAVSKVTDMAVEVAETAVVSQAVARIAVVEAGAVLRVAAVAMLGRPAAFAGGGTGGDGGQRRIRWRQVLAEAVMAAQAVAAAGCARISWRCRRPTEATLTVRGGSSGGTCRSNDRAAAEAAATSRRMPARHPIAAIDPNAPPELRWRAAKRIDDGWLATTRWLCPLTTRS